jgi:ELWxxDGT repeat protein
MYFAANDGATGSELWRSDGTEAGTWQVADLVPGPTGSSPSRLVTAGDNLFFTTSQGLWVHDGVNLTLLGPVQMSGTSELTPVGSSVFFKATDSAGFELWTSNGSSDGTRRVKDINPGPSGSSPGLFTEVDGVVMFRATTAASGDELWRTDGTEAGTYLVRDIRPGAADSSLSNLTAYNGLLFFVATDGSNVDELWRSDGTPDGTFQFKDVNPFVDSLGFPAGSGIQFITPVGDKLFFFASTTERIGAFNTKVPGLWTSDGTPSGTNRVTTLVSDTSFSPGLIFDLNGLAIFTTLGTLWRSDGSSAGTQSLFTSHYFRASDGVVVADRMYMAGGVDRNIIFYTDGTVAGTGQVDHTLTLNSTRRMVLRDGSLYLDTSKPLTGHELYRLDPVSNSLSVVKDINSIAVTGSDPQQFRKHGDAVYFLAGRHYSVYRTDGTAAGTSFVGTFAQNTTGAALNTWSTAEQDGKFVFQINGKIYSTDGSASGTTLVSDFGTWSNISPLVQAGNRIFFAATSGTLIGLWVLDGGVCTRIATLPASSFSVGSFQMAAIENVVYFGWGSGTDRELWRSDGTSAGTFRVADVLPGATGSSPQIFSNVNGKLFFYARAADGNYRLFKSDGSASGTYLVSETVRVSYLSPTSSPPPGNTASIGDVLFFMGSGEDAVGNVELWRSDGTAAGTYRVRDLNGSLDGSYPWQLTSAGDRIYFTARAELWTSDGSENGTIQISQGLNGDCYPDLFLGPQNGPVNLTVLSNRLYFVASSAATGIELFSTDGTLQGTRLEADVRTGSLNGLYNSFSYVRRPSDLATLGHTLVFFANNGIQGFEPWRVDAPPVAKPLGPIAVTEGQTLKLDATASVGHVVSFEWDLDYTGTFTADLTGSEAIVPASWLDGPAVKMVALRVTGRDGQTHVATTSVTINSVAPTATISQNSPVAENSAVSVALSSAFDPSVSDTAAGFRYSYDFTNDGDFDDPGEALDVSSASWSYVFPDNGVYSVTARIADKDGDFTDYSTTVTVSNVVPSAGVLGPGIAVPGQPLIYQLTAADPSPADRASGFSFVINWGDGTPSQIIDPSPDNGFGTLVRHVFVESSAGSYSISVVAVDKDGGVSSTATQSTTVTPTNLQQDPADIGKQALFVGATIGNDRIEIRRVTSTSVRVLINSVSQGVYSPTGRIVVFGQAGEDIINMDGGVSFSSEIYAGAGDDVVKGSNGSVMLFGEDGNDQLTGGAGRDIIVGGNGSDELTGGAGDDILIGGVTDYDDFVTNHPAINNLHSEWKRFDLAYGQRIAHLLSGTGLANGFALSTATVHDDGVRDLLSGAAGQDWFLRGSGDIVDRSSDEIVST